MITLRNRLGMEFSVKTRGPNEVVVTHRRKSMALPLSEQQFTHRFSAWLYGMRVQEAFPELTAPQREFIMTGLTSEEFDAAFPEE